MNKKCVCLGCKTQKYYDTVRNKQDNPTVSGNISSIYNGYKLILEDHGTNDGYFLRNTKEITIFDYSNLLAEYFNYDIDIDYDEDRDITINNRDLD